MMRRSNKFKMILLLLGIADSMCFQSICAERERIYINSQTGEVIDESQEEDENWEYDGNDYDEYFYEEMEDYDEQEDAAEEYNTEENKINENKTSENKIEENIVVENKNTIAEFYQRWADLIGLILKNAHLISQSMIVPITEVPITEIPVTEVPITEVPVAEAPITEVPETEIPIMEVAVTETPDSEMPITEVPITVVPITDIPDADNTAQIYEKTDEDISGTQIPEIVSAVWNKNLQKIISVRVCSEHGIQILSVHINGQECGWHWDGEMICVEINEQIQKALFKYSDRGSYKQDSRITLSMILLAGDHKLQKLEIDVIPEKGLNLYNYPTRDHT